MGMAGPISRTLPRRSARAAGNRRRCSRMRDGGRTAGRSHRSRGRQGGRCRGRPLDRRTNLPGSCSPAARLNQIGGPAADDVTGREGIPEKPDPAGDRRASIRRARVGPSRIHPMIHRAPGCHRFEPCSCQAVLVRYCLLAGRSRRVGPQPVKAGEAAGVAGCRLDRSHMPGTLASKEGMPQNPPHPEHRSWQRQRVRGGVRMVHPPAPG